MIVPNIIIVSIVTVTTIIMQIKTTMMIVVAIIIFKQFLKKITLSIVEPQVFVFLLLSSPNFAQDANNGENLIYFSSN